MDFGSFGTFLYAIITWPSHLAGQPQFEAGIVLSEAEKVAR